MPAGKGKRVDLKVHPTGHGGEEERWGLRRRAAIDGKRTGYLFFLALMIGLVLVYMRTAHMQSVYRIVCQKEQEQQLRQGLHHQQMLLSGVLESPGQIKKQIAALHVEVCAVGETVPERVASSAVEGGTARVW